MSDLQKSESGLPANQDDPLKKHKATGILAGGGATTGAIIGAILGGPFGAVIGAAIGGGTGAAAGAKYDKEKNNG